MIVVMFLVLSLIYKTNKNNMKNAINIIGIIVLILIIATADTWFNF